MKRLLFLLVLIPFFSFGQSSPVAFKGANTIIIQTQDSSHIAFKKIAMVLQDAGYTIDDLNKDIFNLSTKQKPQTPNSFTLAVGAFVRGDKNAVIVLNGNYQVNTIKDVATFKGPSFGADKLAFQAIEKVAKGYPNASILYEKR